MPRPRGEFKQLKQLTENELMTVRQHLEAGKSPEAVARIIQLEWQKCLDVKMLSLRKTLYRYRESVIKFSAQQAVIEAVAGKGIEAIKKQFNALTELQEACLLQKARLLKLHAKENVGPMLMKQVTDEMKLYGEMLKNLANVQLETGIIVRAPRRVTGMMMDTEGNATAFSWAEEDERLRREILGSGGPEPEHVH